jgi:biopolymer transport protein TolR
MAGGMDLGSPSGRGKKPLDMTINLVPFIDLMAVTICFLIMTAVWTQIGRLQVSQSGGPSDPSDAPDTTLPVTLVITDKELRLSAGPTAFDPIAITRDAKNRMDLSKLQERFKMLKDQTPNQSSITLQTDDNVHYEDLVRVIDGCIGSGLPNVSVSASVG